MSPAIQPSCRRLMAPQERRSEKTTKSLMLICLLPADSRILAASSTVQYKWTTVRTCPSRSIFIKRA